MTEQQATQNPEAQNPAAPNPAPQNPATSNPAASSAPFSGVPLTGQMPPTAPYGEQTPQTSPVMSPPAGAAPTGSTVSFTSAVSSPTATVSPLSHQAPQAPAAPQAPQSTTAQDAIIAQQQAQIEALMGQNQALNQQVVQFIQGGAQLTAQPDAQQYAQSAQNTTIAQPSPSPQVQQMMQMGAQPDPLGTFNPPSLAAGQDMSLEALASEIGKSDE